MTEFCFSTPRIIMQRCFASITTATPRGCSACISASAICVVRLFLDLQSTREHIHNPRDFGKANDFSVGNISDVRLADKRKQMVLAHRIKLDVFDENDLARFRIEDRIVDHLIEVLPITGSQKFECARCATRGFKQPFALRIFANGFEQARETIAPCSRPERRRSVESC